jgi:glucosamine-phosphate N-acetyltransferase|tara:strand:- start:1298 stop:1723 length:426 start_codon:yes stop_codon:yes gene_type:complete
MNIIILNKDTDEKYIKQYMECISVLNKSDCVVQNVEDVRERLRYRKENIITFLGIAEDNVVATSTILLEIKLRYSKMCCHIEDVATKVEDRGKGYGKMIVAHCIKAAKDNDCYKVKLNCEESVIPFYDSLGFKHQGAHMYL